MGKFKYKLKEINIGDVTQQSGVKSTVTDIDPETGSITWDIEYKEDINKIILDFQVLKKDFKRILSSSKFKNDTSLKNLYNELNISFNKFRTHIRNNYPNEYANIKEMSTTGGGATFNSGEGEQYVSKKIGNPQKYLYKLGYKLVPKKIKGSGLEVKQLFEEEFNDFQKKRIDDFENIKQNLKQIYNKLTFSKEETINYYKNNSENYNVIYSTDLILDYLKDIKKLLNINDENTTN